MEEEANDHPSRQGEFHYMLKIYRQNGDFLRRRIRTYRDVHDEQVSNEMIVMTHRHHAGRGSVRTNGPHEFLESMRRDSPQKHRCQVFDI
jgi:hypothetical protein